MKRTILSSLLVLALVAWLGPAARAQQSQVTLIRNATVLTVTRGTLPNADILIRDGKIVGLGPGLRAPEGARVIDATGMFVMPGMIDAHAHIAVEGFGVNEGSVSVSAMVQIAEVLNSTDINIYRVLAGGVTTSLILHGSANPIGGQSQVIKMRYGAERAEDLIFEGAPPTIKFALGENPKRSNFSPPPGFPRRYPATRMGVMNVIRQAFIEAREYQREWQEYERRKAAGEENLVPPRRDLKLEPLVEILEGKRMVHIHSYRADEILQMIRLAEEFGFQIAAFQHVLEGYKVADEIAAHGAGASTFSDWWAYKVEAYDAIPYNAAIMTRRGVIVSLNSDSPEEGRHLNQEAAKTMKWGGLTENEALRLVTLNPAIQLRVDDRVGSIEVGKDADLALFDHHPLSIFAVCQMVLIDGQVYFDRQQDRARREEIEKEKKELEEQLEKKPEKKKEEEEEPEEEEPEEEEPSRVTAGGREVAR
ncbi:MAG: amidohydrolase [Candidatus Acidoferrales bacterium]